jgi:Spy/CpxP family protein refolding chaperone
MNRICLLPIGIILMCAPAILPQQTPQPRNPGKGATHGYELPDVGEQLKVLTQKLDLAAEQQPKVKAILQELHDATVKLMQNDSLSHEQRLDKVRPLRMKADKQLREVLSDDQKKKLVEYLEGPHSEMHGNLQGTSPAPTQKPQS